MLTLKVRLLTQGAAVPEDVSGARRGGAGPVGARYFVLPNGRPVGVPLRRGDAATRFNSAPLTPTDDPMVWVYDGRYRLRAVPRPKFYDLKTADGVPYFKIALLHGSETLATTAYQQCRYWTRGAQCKFCTIPTSLNAGDTILEKTPEQLAEVVQAAEAEGVIRNILITTGTPDSEDVGIGRLIRLVTAIRRVSDLPIGVQFEPPQDLNLIDELAAAGADAAGIHLETTDERIRRLICPGKYGYGPIDLYRRAWERAVSVFGRGNASTFILHGLGEDSSLTLEGIRQIAEAGVLPVVTPFRPASGSQLADSTPSYLSDMSETIHFYKRVGEILRDEGLNPDRTRAGCHKCGGCTPIQEAFDWAASQ